MSFRYRIRVRLFLILTAFACAHLTEASTSKSVGTYVDLFNGKDLLAFKQLGNANWRIDDGTVRANAGSGFLVTKESYTNFHLKLEFFAAAGTNSGVFFRCDSAGNVSDQTCFEANIFDTRPDQTYRTGGLTGLAAPKMSLNAEDGEWHTYEIYAEGERLRVIMDGRETVYLKSGKHPSGPVALQFASQDSKGEVRFRNVQIRKLSRDKIVSRKSKIDGVWELKSFEMIDAEGKSTAWCEGSYGVIIYTEAYMSVAINCLSDPKEMIHYSGPFSLDGETVVHSVRNFHDPLLNQLFRRGVKMPTKNDLELSGPLAGGGRAVISWERR